MWLWESCCLCSGQDNEAGLLVEGMGCSGNREVPAVKCETMRELIMFVISKKVCVMTAAQKLPRGPELPISSIHAS